MFSAKLKPNARKSTHSGKIRMSFSSEDIVHWEDTSVLLQTEKDDPSSARGPRSSTGGTPSRNTKDRSIWDTQFTEPDLTHLGDSDDVIWLTPDSTVSLQPFPKAKIRGHAASPKSESDRNIFSALGKPSSPSVKRVSETKTSTSHQYIQSKNTSRNFSNLCGRSGKDFVFKKPTAPPPVSRVHLSGSSDRRQKLPISTASTSRSGLSQSRQKSSKRVHAAGVGGTVPTVPKAHAGVRTKRTRHNITPPSSKVSNIFEDDTVFNTKNVFEELGECLATPLTLDSVDEEVEILDEYEDTTLLSKQLKSKPHHSSSCGFKTLEPREGHHLYKDGQQLNKSMKGILGSGIPKKGSGKSGSLGSGMEALKDRSTVQLKSMGQAGPVNANKSSIQLKASSISTQWKTSLSSLIPSHMLPQKGVKNIHTKSTSKQSPIKRSPTVALGKKSSSSSPQSYPIIDLCEVDILDKSEMTCLKSTSKASPSKSQGDAHRKANGSMAPSTVNILHPKSCNARSSKTLKGPPQVPKKAQSSVSKPKGIVSSKSKSLSQKNPSMLSPKVSLLKIVPQKDLKGPLQKPSKTLPQKTAMKKPPPKEPVKTQPQKGSVTNQPPKNVIRKGATKGLPQKNNLKSSLQKNATKSLSRKETTKNLPQRNTTMSKSQKDSNKGVTHSTNSGNRVTSLRKDPNDSDSVVSQGYESPVITLNRLEVRLSPVKLLEEDAGEYDDIDGVLFASFDTQSELESYLRNQPEGLWTHEQPETRSNSSLPETEESASSMKVPIVSFDQKQQQLVADLQKCSSHEILHPKLQDNGFSIRKELIAKGILSTDLRARGIRFRPKKETSASKSRRKHRLTECKKRPKKAKLNTSNVIEEHTATPTTGLKIKFTLPKKNKPETVTPVDSKPSEVSTESVVTKDVKTLPIEESAPFKPFEKEVVSSKSAFVSDALEKYLQEEGKQTTSQSLHSHPLLQNKAASVTFLMPCKQSSYIKTLDMALQQRQMRKSKSKVPTVAETAEKLAKNLKRTSDTLKISGLKQELPKTEDKKTPEQPLHPDSTKTATPVSIAKAAEDKHVKKTPVDLALVSTSKEATSSKCKEVNLIEKKRFLEEKLENVKKKLKESNALRKSPSKGKSQTSWATKLKIVNSRLVQQLSAPGRNAHLIKSQGGNSKPAQPKEDQRDKTDKREGKRKRKNKTPAEFVRLDQQSRCTKEFCQLGCICESINLNLPVEKLTKHCRKSACMFECTCQRSGIRILRTRKRPTIFQEQSMLFYDGVGMFSNSSTSCIDEPPSPVPEREKPGILGPNRGLCARAVVYKRKQKVRRQSNPAPPVSQSTIPPKQDSRDTTSAQTVSLQNSQDKKSQLQTEKEHSYNAQKTTTSSHGATVGEVVPSVLYTPIQVPLSDKRGSVILYAPVSTLPYMVQKLPVPGKSTNAGISSSGILQITNVSDSKRNDNKQKSVAVTSPSVTSSGSLIEANKIPNTCESSASRKTESSTDTDKGCKVSQALQSGELVPSLRTGEEGHTCERGKEIFPLPGESTNPAGKDSPTLVSEDPSRVKSDKTGTSQSEDAACSNSSTSPSGNVQAACHVETSTATSENVPANINPDNPSLQPVSESQVRNGDPTADTTTSKNASTLADEMTGILEDTEYERTIRAVVTRTKSPVRSPTISPDTGLMPAKRNLESSDHSSNQPRSSASSGNAIADLTKSFEKALQGQPQVTSTKTNRTDVPSVKVPFLSQATKQLESDSSKPGMTKTQVFMPGKLASARSKGDSTSRKPLLIEIQSECNWIDTKNEILNTIAKHTGSSQGTPGVVRVGKFLVEIQSKKISENLRLKKSVHPSRLVTSSKTNKHLGPVNQPSTCKTTTLTTTPQEKLSKSIPSLSEAGNPSTEGPRQMNHSSVGTMTTGPLGGKAPLLSILPPGSIMLSDGKNASGYLVPLKAVHDQLGVPPVPKKGPKLVSEMLENKARMKQAVLSLSGSVGSGSQKNATSEDFPKCPTSSLDTPQGHISDVLLKSAASSSSSEDTKASTPAVSDDSLRLGSESIKPVQALPGTSDKDLREVDAKSISAESSENSSSLENDLNVTAAVSDEALRRGSESNKPRTGSVQELREADAKSIPVESSGNSSSLENALSVTPAVNDEALRLGSKSIKPRTESVQELREADAKSISVESSENSSSLENDLNVTVGPDTVEQLKDANASPVETSENVPNNTSGSSSDGVSKELIDDKGSDGVQASNLPPSKHIPHLLKPSSAPRQPPYPVTLSTIAPSYQSKQVPVAPETTHQKQHIVNSAGDVLNVTAGSERVKQFKEVSGTSAPVEMSGNPSLLQNVPNITSRPGLDGVSEEFIDVEGLDGVQPNVFPPSDKHRPRLQNQTPALTQSLYPVALISDTPRYQSMFVPIAPKVTKQKIEFPPEDTNEEIDVVSCDDTRSVPKALPVINSAYTKNSGGNSQPQSLGSKRKRKSPVRQKKSVMADEEPEFIESYFEVSSGEEDATEEEPKKGKRDKPNKVLHLIKERQRRRDQSDLFGGLKFIMLNNKESKVAKVAILEMAVKEIKQLESQSFSMEIEKTKLKQESFQKRSKLASLLGVNIMNFPTPFTDKKDPDFDDYLKELHDGSNWSSPVSRSETTSQDSESVNMDSSDGENDIEEKTSEEQVLVTEPSPVPRTESEVLSKNYNHVDNSIAEHPPKRSDPTSDTTHRKPALHLGLPKTIPGASVRSRVMRKQPVSKSSREAQVSPKGPVPVALTALPFDFNMAPVQSTPEKELVSESVSSLHPLMNNAPDVVSNTEKPGNDGDTRTLYPADPSAKYGIPFDLTVSSKNVPSDKNVSDKNVDESPQNSGTLSRRDSQTSPDESGKTEIVEKLIEKHSENMVTDSESTKSSSESPEKCDLAKARNSDIVQGETRLPDTGTKENGIHGDDDDVEMIDNDQSSEIIIVEDGGTSWPPNSEKTGSQKGSHKKGNTQKVSAKKASPESDSSGSLNVLSIQTKGGVVNVTCDNGEVIPLALVKASSDGTMQVAVEGDISSEKVEELLSKTEVMECLEKVADDSCEK